MSVAAARARINQKLEMERARMHARILRLAAAVLAHHDQALAARVANVAKDLEEGVKHATPN